MVSGLVIEAAPHTTDGTAFTVAGKGFVHRRTRSEIGEIQRSPDMVLRPRPDSIEDCSVYGVGMFFHGDARFRQKLYWFFRNQGL